MDTDTIAELLDALDGTGSERLSGAQIALLTALHASLLWMGDDDSGSHDFQINDMDYLEFLAADECLLPEEVWWFASGRMRLVLASTLPACDLCGASRAHYDAPVPHLDGRWANLCEGCWSAHCPPALGASIGQRLETYDTVPARVTQLCDAVRHP